MAHRPVDLWPDWEISRRALPVPDPDGRSVFLGAFDGDTLAGTAHVAFPLKDNVHLAFLGVWVRPERRRGGVGTALLARVESLVADDRRTTLLADVYAPLEGENEGSRFAAAHGYAVANVDNAKVVGLRATEPSWPGLEAAAAERRDDYELVWWTDPTPEEHVAGLCAAMSRFIGEIPLGDLDLQAQAWTPERLRAREERRLAQGRLVVLVAAVAPDGSLAGYTNLTWSQHAPRVADIMDTLVLPEHRGHRLGLGMKVLLHQQLRRLSPDTELVATGNATTNRWMNEVNEQLGYRVVDRTLELQKVLG
jgi:GNAT superfamily N-acetyltransferase